MPARFPSDWVSGFDRNGCPLSAGIGGRFHRNTHFSEAKAWGKRTVAIDNQVRLAIVTSILVAMMLATTLGGDGLTDTKALRRQARRQAKQPDQPDGRLAQVEGLDAHARSIRIRQQD